MPSANRLQRGITATLVGRVVYMVSNAVLLVVLTRFLLDPDGYGLLYLALSILGVAKLFGGLGLAKAGARYVTEYDERDQGQVPHVLRRTLGLNAVTVVVSSVGLVIASPYIADLVDEPRVTPLLVVGAAYIAAASAAGYPQVMFQAFNRVTWSAVVRGLEGVARLGFAVGLVVLGLGVTGALLGYVFGLLAAASVGFVVLYRRFYRSVDADDAPAEGLTRRIAGYALPVSVTRGADVLDSKVDTILVGALMTTTAVGFYTLARQVAVFAVVPAKSLGYTLSPALGEEKAGKRVDRARHLYQRSLEHVLLLYVPAAVGLFLVTPPLVEIVFGDDFLGAVPVLQVLSAFVVVFAVNSITSDALDYLGRARARAKVRGVTAVANVGLNLLLIPAVGVVGAAVATVLTYTTYTAANVYVIHGELALDVARLGRELATVAGVAVGTGLVVAGALPLVTDVVTLAGVVVAGVLTWAALVVGTGAIRPRTVIDWVSS